MAENTGGTTMWWARQDSNLQPDRYERPALTIELRAPPRTAAPGGRQRCGPRLQGVLQSRNAAAQSTETPANSTTLRHFSVSSATSLPNSAGLIGLGTPPTAASFAASFGSFSASPTALFSFAMISGGVPLGTEMP